MPFKYYGGVHPDEMKQPTLATSYIKQPPQVVIPLQMHIGAPCQPLVKVGDEVKIGTKIAERNDHFYLPLFNLANNFRAFFKYFYSATSNFSSNLVD